MDYLIHIAVFCCIYTVLAESLDLLVGHAGILSLVHAAFYATGAYTCAIIAVHLQWPFPVALLLGCASSGVVAFGVAALSIRLRGDLFVIATFACHVVILGVVANWIGLTRGPLGIFDIPHAVVLGCSLDTGWQYALMALTMALLAWAVVQLLVSSPFGRVLHAVREDDVLAMALGKNVFYFKSLAFIVAGVLAAGAGGIYAHYMRFIDPTSFTVMESILIASMVIIGGAGSRWGPVVGAVLLICLPEVLRVLGLPGSVAAHLRQIIYGVLLVVMMRLRPQGLVGHFAFGR